MLEVRWCVRRCDVPELELLDLIGGCLGRTLLSGDFRDAERPSGMYVETMIAQKTRIAPTANGGPGMNG